MICRLCWIRCVRLLLLLVWLMWECSWLVRCSSSWMRLLLLVWLVVVLCGLFMYW